jgi:hypothetical protein
MLVDRARPVVQRPQACGNPSSRSRHLGCVSVQRRASGITRL